MDDFPERLKEILNNESLTATAFAELIGVQRSGLSHILSGRNKPSLELVERIHHSFPHYSYTYLIEGREEITNVMNVTQGPGYQEANNNKGSTLKKEYWGTENDSIVTSVTPDLNAPRLVRVHHYFSDGSFESYTLRKENDS